MPARRAASFWEMPWASMRSHRALGSTVGSLGGLDSDGSLQHRLHPSLEPPGSGAGGPGRRPTCSRGKPRPFSPVPPCSGPAPGPAPGSRCCRRWRRCPGGWRVGPARFLPDRPAPTRPWPGRPGSCSAVPGPPGSCSRRRRPPRRPGPSGSCPSPWPAPGCSCSRRLRRRPGGRRCPGPGPRPGPPRPFPQVGDQGLRPLATEHRWL